MDCGGGTWFGELEVVFHGGTGGLMLEFGPGSSGGEIYADPVELARAPLSVPLIALPFAFAAGCWNICSDDAFETAVVRGEYIVWDSYDTPVDVSGWTITVSDSELELHPPDDSCVVTMLLE